MARAGEQWQAQVFLKDNLHVTGYGHTTWGALRHALESARAIRALCK
ncbi:MAG: hypothetical protein HZC41_21990 [Chloroflexi bacterium]|nr:hypothetical protein [Chloroflexota bacterium]